jgi:prepilin-type N-terminal cleavage/methylation domain-containing protein/prepilin-type processing-associated H-X9-DG protein
VPISFGGIKHKGFTLIELLVVIAIIAILAAIIFPVFSMVREKARQASCQSNLRQIAMAVKMYTVDYDEKFPIQDTFGVSWPTGIPSWIDPSIDSNWARSIFPYIKSYKVLVCLSSKLIEDPYPVSYFGNGMIFETHISEAAVESPSNTVIFQCYGKAERVLYDFPTKYRSPNQWFYEGENDWHQFFMHADGTNFAFVDGHVKWLSYNQATSDLTKFLEMFMPQPPNAPSAL